MLGRSAEIPGGQRVVLIPSAFGVGLRVAQLWESLELAGWRVELWPEPLSELARLDSGWLVVACTPQATDVWEALAQAAARGVPMVLDLEGAGELPRELPAMPTVVGYLVAEPSAWGEEMGCKVRLVPPALTMLSYRLALEALLARAGLTKNATPPVESAIDGRKILAWVGSPACIADVGSVADELVALIESRPEIELRLFGVSEPPAELACLGEKLVCLPAAMAGPSAEGARSRDAGPWPRLGPHSLAAGPKFLAALAACDLLLAPRSSDGQGCQQTAWDVLLAAAVAVPAVASRSAGVGAMIEPGVTGLLVEGGGWRTAVEGLLGDAERRKIMGRMARARALGRHATSATWRRASMALLEAAFGTPRGRPARVAVIRALARFAAADHPGTDECPVAERAPSRSGSLPSREGELVEITARFLAEDHHVVLRPNATGEIQPVDVILASAEEMACGQADWDLASPALPSEEAPARGTAAGAGAASADAASLAPWVSVTFDDHALTRPMGPAVAAAEAAYQRSRVVAASGPWLAKWLASNYGLSTTTLALPLDARSFWPGAAIRAPLVVYELPRHRRPLSLDLGVQTLQHLRYVCPQARIVLFGVEQDALASEGIDLPHEWAGQLEAADRAALFRRAAVLLWTEFTNVNPTVAEAMACGCAVVGVDLAHQRWLLVDGQTASLTVPRPDLLAEAIKEVLRDEPRRLRLALNACRAVADQTLDRAAMDLAATLLSLAGSAAEPHGARAHRVPGWPPRLDVVSAGAEEPAPWPLAAEPTTAITFVSCHDGLSGLDLALASSPPPDLGQLSLLLGDRVGAGGAVEPLLVAQAPQWDGLWLRFRFPPLTDSGGRRWYAQVCAARLPDHPIALWTSRQGESEARMLVAGRETSYAPCFATWVTEDPIHAITLPPATAAMLNRLLVLEAEVDLERREWERNRSSLPYRLRHPLAGVARRLPPAAERPWPADAPVTVKLRRALAEYGLLAVLAEVRDWLRWQRMTAAEREQARLDEAGAEPER